MTQPEDIKRAILGLPGKTLAAKLRQLMPEIDQRVRDGVGHDEIVETLKQHGIEVKLETFRKYLYRYRKRMRGKDAASAADRKSGASHRTTAARDSVGKPDSSTIRPISNKGELKQARDVDFDLDGLAEAAKEGE